MVTLIYSITFGTTKKWSSRLRCVGENRSGIAAGGHHIVAHFELLSDHAGHRLDAFDIDFLKLLNPAEDAVQFCHHRLDSLFRESDVGKFRDTADGALSTGMGARC